MSPAQYCARFGIAESTLRGWLKKGLMEGAEKNDGVWDIPEDARARYEPRKKKNRTQDDNRWDLLKALKERRYVDEKVILCQKADFVDLANDLLDKGLIIKSSTPCDGRWNTGYAISQTGLDAIEYITKKDFIDFWKATCSGNTVESECRVLPNRQPHFDRIFEESEAIIPMPAHQQDDLAPLRSNLQR